MVIALEPLGILAVIAVIRQMGFPLIDDKETRGFNFATRVFGKCGFDFGVRVSERWLIDRAIGHRE